MLTAQKACLGGIVWCKRVFVCVITENKYEDEPGTGFNGTWWQARRWDGVLSSNFSYACTHGTHDEGLGEGRGLGLGRKLHFRQFVYKLMISWSEPLTTYEICSLWVNLVKCTFTTNHIFLSFCFVLCVMDLWFLVFNFHHFLQKWYYCYWTLWFSV